MTTKQKPNVGLNKNADNLLNTKSPTFKIVDAPRCDDKFANIKTAIESLEIGKRLEISNIQSETGISMNDFKTKIRNMVFSHQRKFVEKQFSTQQITKTTIAIDRQK